MPTAPSEIHSAASRRPRRWLTRLGFNAIAILLPSPDAFPSATWTPTSPTAAPIYHGFSANLRKRFAGHYEFLASYTWSHAIDDSTDLQSTLTPQDSYYPAVDRSTSLFDQRHRFVFSGVYQTGKLGGSGFVRKVFSDWTFAPLLEIGSRAPVQHHHRQRR